MFYLLAANSFLGLKSPTDGTCFSNSTGCGGQPIGAAVGGVVGNIVGDLFVIAAFVAAIFVVYGGIKYVISMGSPDKMAGAKDTLTRALMGYFIALIANVIVNVVMTATGNAGGGAGTMSNLADLIGQVLMLTGILGVVMTIISGILYGISAGDPSKVTKAKNALITSLVGTVVAFLGTAIINFVKDNATPATTDLKGVAAVVVPALMWVAGVVSVVGLIVAGIMYATASGDEAKVARAKNFIKFSIVGLAVAILAFALQTFVLGAVGG
jgi:hypothetical protein